MPRFLFAGSLAVAGVLGLGVLLAPLLQEELPLTVVRLFASDTVVRRTALACAGGLTVTAFVFFRTARAATRKATRAARAAPGNIAGA